MKDLPFHKWIPYNIKILFDRLISFARHYIRFFFFWFFHRIRIIACILNISYDIVPVTFWSLCFQTTHNVRKNINLFFMVDICNILFYLLSYYKIRCIIKMCAYIYRNIKRSNTYTTFTLEPLYIWYDL